MQFTYNSYVEMINLLKAHSYEFSFYNENKSAVKEVVLRHDVDMSLESALEISKIEKKLQVKSLFFILLRTNFYNVFEEHSLNIVKQIIANGGVIGLHFDEKQYENELAKFISQNDSVGYKNFFCKFVSSEKEIVEKLLNCEIKYVSMHRPSKYMLAQDVLIPNIINVYSKKIFDKYHYLSDSRCLWKEDILKVIGEEKYDNLNILTHPIWYNEIELNIADTMKNFCNNAIVDRYNNLQKNITNLTSIVSIEDLLKETNK